MQETTGIARRLAAVVVALTLVGLGLTGCKRLRSVFGTGSVMGKLDLESCDDARKYPDQIFWDDVRWVDCDRPANDSKAEAFTLGEPIHDRIVLPAQDSLWYSVGNCEHGGRSITDHNLWYRPEDIGVAIDCSRRRCQAGDALGCEDLGMLNWYEEFFPAVKKNEAVALGAFEAGCSLGNADCCSMLGHLQSKRGESARAWASLSAACLATIPDTKACEEVGDEHLRHGKESEAKRFYLRGCRGTTHLATAAGAHRDGCRQLAELAGRHGDEPSRREYLRLDCAYAANPTSCQELGLILLSEGDRSHALPYFRKACGVLPGSRQVYRRACEEIGER